MDEFVEALKTYDRCRVCIEEDCGGKHNCHCATCENFSKCPKFLSATIRITNKCTQECSHCCFNSSPKSKIMMSVDMAKDIAKFIEANHIIRLNLMGGEFFCNPDWYEIFDLLIGATKHARIVSNSDWAHSDDVKNKLKVLYEKYGDRFYMALSNDKWHTNKNVDEAEKFLTSVGIFCKNEKDIMTDDSIVPVGRGELTYGFYSMFSAYCLQPDNKYSMLIDEEGNIYKCAFGTWKYDNIKDYINGGFEDRFKDFQQSCKKVFISNCRVCRRSAERYSGTKEANGEEIVVKCK